MTASSAPFGLDVARAVGGAPHAVAGNTYRIASLTTATIFTGQPVRLTSDGVIDILTSAGITTGGAVGIFVGCEYTDPNLGYKLQKKYWPGGTSATDAVAYVIDSPWQTFRIQADSSVGTTAVGAVAGMTTASYTSGSTLNGSSYGMLRVGSIGTSDAMFRIVGFVPTPDNAAGDAYTVVEVAWANHQFNTTAGV